MIAPGDVPVLHPELQPMRPHQHKDRSCPSHQHSTSRKAAAQTQILQSELHKRSSGRMRAAVPLKKPACTSLVPSE